MSKSFRLKLVEPGLTSVDERGVSKSFRLKLVEPSLRSVDERGVSKSFRLKLVEPTSERQRAGRVETTRRPSWYSRPRLSIRSGIGSVLKPAEPLETVCRPACEPGPRREEGRRGGPAERLWQSA